MEEIQRRLTFIGYLLTLTLGSVLFMSHSVMFSHLISSRFLITPEGLSSFLGTKVQRKSIS